MDVQAAPAILPYYTTLIYCRTPRQRPHNKAPHAKFYPCWMLFQTAFPTPYRQGHRVKSSVHSFVLASALASQGYSPDWLANRRFINDHWPCQVAHLSSVFQRGRLKLQTETRNNDVKYDLQSCETDRQAGSERLEIVCYQLSIIAGLNFTDQLSGAIDVDRISTDVSLLHGLMSLH